MDTSEKALWFGCGLLYGGNLMVGFNPATGIIVMLAGAFFTMLAFWRMRGMNDEHCKTCAFANGCDRSDDSCRKRAEEVRKRNVIGQVNCLALKSKAC